MDSQLDMIGMREKSIPYFIKQSILISIRMHIQFLYGEKLLPCETAFYLAKTSLFCWLCFHCTLSQMIVIFLD